ncbi:MAG: flavodoxin family protein [Deltaproteobacteria bacterium]|jgi:flavodoxin|nr:flavodoxin family protein [Deltaproteobacteria bacterium]
MKTLIVYSSLTGNTRKVAQAISEAIGGSEMAPVGQSPDPAEYPLVLAGFWVDKGQADAKSKDFLSRLRDKMVGFFFTLGAYPDSPHADDVERVTAELLRAGGNDVLGSFRCQGKVDPELLERMKRMLPPDHPHAQMTEERKARLDEAARHPSDEDLMRARAFADDIYRKALSAPARPGKAARQ